MATRDNYDRSYLLGLRSILSFGWGSDRRNCEPDPAISNIEWHDEVAIRKESDLFWKPDLPQPKYGESAMTSEAIGSAPKPKRHWVIRRGDMSLGHTELAWIVELHEGENRPEHRIHSTMLRRLHFWPEKRGVFCTRQMTLAEVNDEIVKSKARLLGEQAIVDSQSGPANRSV